MTLLARVSESGRHAARGSGALAYDAKVDATGADVHFPLNESSGATSVTDRIGGLAGTIVNDIEMGLPSLVSGRPAGRASVAFDGDEDFPGHIVIEDLLTSAELGVALLIQPDLVKAKHVVLTSTETGGITAAGHMSLELVDDGAGGLSVRAFSVDSGGTAHVIVGSVGDIAQGEAVHLAYVRISNANPSQIVYVDGEIVAQDANDRGAWPNVPVSSWHLGTWPTLVSPTDAAVAELVGWTSPPSQADIQSLATPQGFSQVEDLTADDIPVSSTALIGMADRTEPGFHTKGTLIPEPVTPASLATVTPFGQSFQVEAGATAGADSFTYRVIDDRGPTNVATISYTVTEDDEPPAPSGTGPWQGLGVGIYVCGLNYADLNISSTRPAIKFVCERTGTVSGVKYHHRVNQPGQTGYSAGDGGIIRAKLHAYNNGQPGAVLAQTSVFTPNLSAGQGTNIPGKLLTLTSPVQITAGTRYFWVWYNEHANPSSNYSGFNSMQALQHDFNNNCPGNQGIGMFPVFGSNHWVMRGSATYAFNHKNPLFTTVYTDGGQIGQQVVTNRRDDRATVSGSNRIRQRMTPSTDRTVRWVYANCFKTIDQSSINMTVQVKNSAGTVLATATIPASAIGYDPDILSKENLQNNTNDPQTASGEFRQAPWTKGLLSQQLTLQAGTTYFVEFSASAGSGINFLSMQVLNTNNYNDPRYQEARGQFSTNGGSTWTNALDTGTPSTSSVWAVLLHFNDTDGSLP